MIGLAKQRKRLVGITLATLVLNLAMPFSSVHAVSTSGSRSTAAPSAPRGATGSRSISPASRGVTTANRGASASRSTASPNVRTGGSRSNTKTSSPSARNTVGNKSIEAQRAGARATKTSTYKSLTNPKERASYVNWYENYSNDSLRYFTSINYFYMPWNIWNAVILGNNQNKNQDKLASNMVSAASQRNYRWIRVDDKMVALPQSVYNKVKVGDKITLVDNNHIKINGKMVK